MDLSRLLKSVLFTLAAVAAVAVESWIAVALATWLHPPDAGSGPHAPPAHTLTAVAGIVLGPILICALFLLLERLSDDAPATPGGGFLFVGASLVIIAGTVASFFFLLGAHGLKEVDLGDNGFQVDANNPERGVSGRARIRNTGSEAVRICAGRHGVCDPKTAMLDLAPPGRTLPADSYITVEVPVEANGTRRTWLTIVDPGSAITRPDAVLVVRDGPGQ